MMKYPIAMQFMVVFACNICFTYFQPILANFYLEAYDIKEETVGYLMSIVTAGYAIGTVLISQVRHRKCMMVFGGLVLMGIAYFFVGPDKGFTGGDHHLWTTLASQALMGFAAANSYIPAVPILNEVLAYYYPA
jgi:predicted MFS family arabinose efflux permease